jgi:hypothetical protein
MEINKELNDIFQEYFVQPQLIDSEESQADSTNKGEGIKRAIQKMFIKHIILEFDDIKPLLEDVDGANKLYEAICDKETKEVANEVFYGAIKEVQDLIAGQYGLAPRVKKEYEKLAEELEGKYGDGAIESNINRLILKNRGL